MGVVSEQVDPALAAAATAVPGVRVLAHARDLGSGRDVGLGADTPVVLASVFKVPVVVELAAQVGEGQLDPAQRIRVASARRTSGGTGISALVDDVELSLRDLAQLMISVSDNTATDVVCEAVGIPAVNARMRALELPGTVVEGDCAWLLGRLVDDLGLEPEERNRIDADEAGFIDAVPVERWARCRDLRAETTNRSTPREMTRLLELVWSDHALDGDGTALVRRIMGQQVWPHRLRSGYGPAWRVAGKTGTLPFIRNEVGVVEHRDGTRHAVAVFTVADTPTLHLPAADALIGSVARALSTHLGAPE